MGHKNTQIRATEQAQIEIIEITNQCGFCNDTQAETSVVFFCTESKPLASCSKKRILHTEMQAEICVNCEPLLASYGFGTVEEFTVMTIKSEVIH